MGELGEGSQDHIPDQSPDSQNTEPSAQTEASWRSILYTKIKDALSTFDPRERQIPPEEIQDSTTAYVIYNNLRNPVLRTQPGEIPFTIRDVLANAGYTAPFKSQDMMQRYPEQYHLFRQHLNSFVRDGILESEEIPQRTEDNETVKYYIPKDESGADRQRRLQDLARQATEISEHYKLKY